MSKSIFVDGLGKLTKDQYATYLEDRKWHSDYERKRKPSAIDRMRKA